MSFSEPSIKNPATRFFRWSGGEAKGGVLTWYDKESEEEKKVDFPFSFVVLDELNTIGGFSDADKSSYWSNEVRNLKRDELVVKTGSGVKARGIYDKLADVRSKGAKYAKSVYVSYKDETGELAIGNIKLMGAALTAWIEFTGKYNVTKCAVSLTGADGPKTKGTTKYFVPIFEGQNLSEETISKVTALDKELQSYLRQYLSYVPDDQPQEETATKEDVEVEDVPESEVAPDVKQENNEGDETIKVSDVPF
jgi:hypothetical protein